MLTLGILGLALIGVMFYRTSVKNKTKNTEPTPEPGTFPDRNGNFPTSTDSRG